jgi:hypothetical protein
VKDHITAAYRFGQGPRLGDIADGLLDGHACFAQRVETR